MKPLSIVVTAVLVAAISLMLGPGAPWWLEHIDGVTGLHGKDLAAAVDAVRGRALAVATGLAALGALFYTARNAETARRTFQLGERGHDTDRYSKAAEQLGHAEAPVRLAGLYALEELAQNNFTLRQTIVNVISAYLRMPYTPPENDQNSSSPADTDTAAPSDGQEHHPREELQVRLTAQRILAAHLRYPPATRGRWWQHAASPPCEFWPGIRLDLTGAALHELDFQQCQVHHASFVRATFSGLTQFNGATFVDLADFSWATAKDEVSFKGAAFDGYAAFGAATFEDLTDFSQVTFNKDTMFGATTLGIASFNNATFTGEGWFHETTFTFSPSFRGAEFVGEANFAGATLGTKPEPKFPSAKFAGSVFPRGANFGFATFAGPADFSHATFASRSSFDHATFRAEARFPQDHRARHLDFNEAQVAPAAMTAVHEWPPGWRVEPNGTGGGVLHHEGSHDPQSPVE